MIKDDLEALTGQLIKGDVTDVVIQLLKGTQYKEDLLKYLPFCSDKDLRERVLEGCKNASLKEFDTTTIEENNSRPSLKKWLAEKGLNDSI